MLAIIKTGGKQYKVTKGDKLKIEKIKGEVDETVVFDKVLLVSDEKGEKLELGQPELKDRTVEAKILEQGRARKVRVVKYKAKTRYHKVYGHRQPFTKIEILSVK